MQIGERLVDASHQHGVAGQTFDTTELDSTAVSPSIPSVVGVENRDVGHYTPVQASKKETGVSVKRAEADFAQLSREFSHISEQNRKSVRSNSRRSDLNGKDVEKTASSDREDESFDLEETLRGNRDQDAQYGIKSKRIGVLWEDLTVSGIGGSKNIIKTFPQGSLPLNTITLLQEC